MIDDETCRSACGGAFYDYYGEPPTAPPIDHSEWDCGLRVAP